MTAVELTRQTGARRLRRFKQNRPPPAPKFSGGVCDWAGSGVNAALRLQFN